MLRRTAFLLAICAVAQFPEVTTDPIKLWSPPESQSRLEKNYFDSNFEPFYRTEQLIITAPTLNVTKYKTFPFGNVIPFGPVLGLDVLHQVLDLQTQIEHMQVYFEKENRTISLSDVCYAPLAPENTNCTIESVLNYWQNSHENLDKQAWDDNHFFMEADYHDHFMACVGAPSAIDDKTALHMPCLGTYGGPVFPWTALGDYDGENYNNATILIITFPIKNYKPDDKEHAVDLERAHVWENAFLEFMQNYSNPNLTIAFQAEGLGSYLVFATSSPSRLGTRMAKSSTGFCAGVDPSISNGLSSIFTRLVVTLNLNETRDRDGGHNIDSKEKKDEYMYFVVQSLISFFTSALNYLLIG